ncbi:GNAT family N-acetyltransferase [Ramlibacter sp. AN1133]|uniref:GNAT family N-acetyltransferase n=1 Tax=Ramlibacter sp. AN1133 TaxID=3133429 RepID=UPI0030C5E983
MKMNAQLRHVETNQDFHAAFAVMRELRPHLVDADAFIAQLQRQAHQGYRLLGAWDGMQVLGLAGYRHQENLIYGRFIYIDDLVTTGSVRSRGIGAALINAVREEAYRHGCKQLMLDTALGNSLAQRFYFRQGLLSRALHFGQALAKE